MTRADKIRTMNNEELARLFAAHADCSFCPVKSKTVKCYMIAYDESTSSDDYCLTRWLQWLNEEAKKKRPRKK